MSQLRERKIRTEETTPLLLDSDEASSRAREKSIERKVKKVEPDQGWIQRLKSDLTNSRDKRKPKLVDRLDLEEGTYWLTRIVFLRFLAFIYLVAFLVSYNQNKELIGNRGLTPARNFLLNGKSNQVFLVTEPDNHIFSWRSVS